MSVQLNVSNSLISLSKLLIEDLKKNESVFRPVYIVTQTEGMNTWLKLQIANSLGIAANIRFVRPNDIIYKVFLLLGGRFTDSISAHDLNWILYRVLNEDDFKKEFPDITNYYDTGTEEKEVKRMALAEKIADLFDQYQIYRSDMMQQWDKGESFASESKFKRNVLKKFEKDEKWQRYLWARAKKIAGNDFPDKNQVGKYILDTLSDKVNVSNLKDQLPVVHFFGISLFTSYHLEIFHKLSNHIDIRFLIQNPCPGIYWFEDKTEKVIDFLKRKGFAGSKEESLANPLLVGWGKLIQNTFGMMFADEDLLNVYNETGVTTPGKDTLLHYIQDSIFSNEKEGISFSNEMINDGSVTINSCYSPAREVEVLYNYLVHLADQKKESLTAMDILVSVTDIDLYASYIKAVFDNAPYRFNYTIADESHSSSDSIFAVLSEILSLTERQFTSEIVVSLLNSSILRKHFAIENIPLIRKIIEKANIRFGFEGNRADETIYVSWKYGFKRVMYGLCMSGESEFGEGSDGFYPIDEAEGGAIFEITRFVYFVDSLIDSVRLRHENRSISDWAGYVQNTIDRFIGTREDNDDEDYNLLSGQLEKYNVLNQIFTEEVSYEVFSHHFLPTLTQIIRSKSFATGGITFCSLIPMRSIPFKVVAVLGMDYDKFPRQTQHVSFDLMKQQKRKGDRDIKENDKHLFLETLLSAEKYLYISYIGQSVKDNSEIPPSSLVDELTDFIANHSTNSQTVKEDFITKHPLHGFSRKYNTPANKRLYSYLLNKNNKVQQWIEDNSPEISDQRVEIEITHFISFLINPIKGYYNKVLNIYYDEKDDELDETELFGMDYLQSWSLKKELFYRDDTDIQSLREQKVKMGELPLRNMGLVVLEDTIEGLKTAKGAFSDLRQTEEERKISLRMAFQDVVFSGEISHIFRDRYIVYSPSKNTFKPMLQAYLNYILFRSAGYDFKANFISYHGSVYSGQKLSKDDSVNRLCQLLKLYRAGHDQLIPFNTKFQFKENALAKMDSEKFEDAVKKIVFPFGGNFYDAYVQKEAGNGFFGQAGTLESFKEAVQILSSPVAGFWGDPISNFYPL